MKFANLRWVVGLCFVVSACSNEPKFSLGPVTMDCDQSRCLVAFDATNTSDGTLPLAYEISLFQNYIRDPNKAGIVVVGTTNGTIDLSPNEKKRVEKQVQVTEEPNGSKVEMYDLRTPKFILEILDT